VSLSDTPNMQAHHAAATLDQRLLAYPILQILDGGSIPDSSAHRLFRYREMEVGFGKEVQREDTCDIAYEVFTQGGLYLDSVGYGMVRSRRTSPRRMLCCATKHWMQIRSNRHTNHDEWPQHLHPCRKVRRT
jgi:hypothetical protein